MSVISLTGIDPEDPTPRNGEVRFDTLATLVSRLEPEAAEQWRLLVDADEAVRQAKRDEDATRARLGELSSRERARATDRHDPDVEFDCDACGGPCEFYTPSEPLMPLTDAEREELASLRVALPVLSLAQTQAEKAKRAPARWLEERGLLDALWKQLWVERHQRGER